jgi:hypothetical protein
MTIDCANYHRKSLEATSQFCPRACGNSTDTGPSLRYVCPIVARYDPENEATQKPFRTGNYKVGQSAIDSITVPIFRVRNPVSSNAD